ncbi:MULTISPECIES: aldehyde dehydrogenase family protein [Pseudonocardia]|uniref:Aldehyde-alcohol dehydrogenase n=2 Tax=Pseudonocardia TaxID=1847 RepID=A0A1Y2MID1_PSEAH|nr:MULTISPECIES: aldehyde dehydrogenase family protein [Pseudonocardia]OSY34831.1 Aldehyde-alcohol dehydrogenase [Pseudonocardia autotrophica]TDN73012.1 acetaldehyde dehydrogenase (acetylating) [Pseudonocardia autotrophica]BBG03731.1 acetaldehyde dehydrogenase (acetylating) [Pseudonocardia autotrophica]GEC29270.1 acetaldehyde dehydrogenase (acetylating) [Pseudonocardia saturnea]
MTAATAPDPPQLDADLAGLADVRTKVRAAAAAFAELAGTDQETLDRYVRAMALAGTKAAEELARLAVDETGYGIYEHKIYKNRYNTGFVAKWMLERRAIGVLWVDDDARVTAVGSPMGVLAGIIPVTNPTSTALFKSLAAVKSGNAIVHAPHPRAARCTLRAVQVMAEAAVAAGAPEGLLSCLENPTLPATRELMSRDEIALVLATGGPGMVRAAYSSGKPTIAVGAGNVPAYVGVSVPDPAEAAEMIITSKSFDNGTACVAEQSVVVVDAVAPAFLAAFEERGAYWMNAPQQAALARVLFDDRGAMRPGSVGQTAPRLAELAGFTVPSSTRVLACRLDTVGPGTPLSREILGPVLSVYQVPDAAAGWRRCREILALDGEGHTTAVHAADPAEIAPFGTLPAGRIVINTPALFGGMGYSTDVDPSFQLGTGTWSGSICSDNVTPLHLINIKRIAHEVRPWRTVYDPVEL